MPAKLYEATKNEIKRLLDNGIIRKSKFGCSSPAFPKEKKNGDIRLLFNCRKPNKVTTKGCFQNPGIDETLRNLSNSDIFSKIDLVQGYYQIKIREKDIRKTGFNLLGQHYEFCRMPMGLTNAPVLFKEQR